MKTKLGKWEDYDLMSYESFLISRGIDEKTNDNYLEWLEWFDRLDKKIEKYIEENGKTES